jgi:hypothetical protein
MNFTKMTSFLLLSIFFFRISTKKTAYEATFQGYLMLYFSIKFDKTCMKMIT